MPKHDVAEVGNKRFHYRDISTSIEIGDSSCDGIVGGRGEHPVYAHSYQQPQPKELIVQDVTKVVVPHKAEYLHVLDELIDMLGLPRERFYASHVGWKSYGCTECGEKYGVPLIVGGCRNPYKGLTNTEYSVKRRLNALSRFKSPYFVRIVPTLPSWVPKKIAEEVARMFLRELQRILCKDSSKLCAWWGLHPTGSDLQPHPHLEIWLFNYAYNEEKDEFYRLRPWINRNVLYTILWKIFDKLGIDAKPQFKIMYYNLKKNFKKCYDAMVYAFRPFSLDVAEYLLKHGLEKTLACPLLKPILDYKPRAHPFGWANRYLKLTSDLEEGEKEARPEEGVSVCPFCGGLAVPITAYVDPKEGYVRCRSKLRRISLEKLKGLGFS